MSKKSMIAWDTSLQPNYGTPRLNLARGKGAYLWSDQDEKYLDFLSGIATNALGHAHPSIIKAVSKQVKTLSHTSNLYSHPQVLELASRLQKLTGSDSARVFFCNSGAEANESALKLSRLTGRKKIISTVGAFHGRTIGSLSMTGQESKREPFEPLLGDMDFVPYGDLKALEKLISFKTAMVIVEPIQGENGVVVPPDGYLKGVRELCDRYDVLLTIDAVQTGIGRTGLWFGYEHEGITPDIITLAKGLGGGLPLGAMISFKEQFSPGQHGSTFGANPIVCAAANSLLNELEKHQYLERVTFLGEKLKKMIVEVSGVAEVRGRGLLLGIVLDGPYANEVALELEKARVLVNAPQANVIRIAPPFVITEGDIRKFVKKFEKALEAARGA